MSEFPEFPEYKPVGVLYPYEPRPYGTCRVCGDKRIVRYDNTISTHAGPGRYVRGGPWDCPGSGQPPADGTLARCEGCRLLYLKEDQGHRFCSEACIPPEDKP